MAFTLLETGQAFLDSGIRSISYISQRELQGSTSAELDITIAKNAVVSQYDLVVQAKRADIIAASDVAQIRVSASADSSLSGHASAIVLDFGTPRTVSGIEVPSGLQIARVKAWAGAAFSTSAAYFADVSGSNVTATPPSTARRAILNSEVRTERLLVEVLGSVDASTIGATMFVRMPEAPSGLEVRIDGGAPVFTFPGPVQPGSAATLSDQSWNQDSQMIVHAGAALAALTGDPTQPDSAVQKFKIVLTTRVPGVLDLKAGGTAVGRIRRLSFAGQNSKDETFANEGQLAIPLTGAVLAGEGVRQVRFTMLGTVPPERVLPPVGPDPSDTADLVLDPNRAAAVFLASNHGLAEITALRLPVAATPDGADARVVLWSADPSTGEPKAPVPNATTQPVSITGGSGTEAWTTFAFKKPVLWKQPATFWAALVVIRGQLTWNLGRTTGLRQANTGALDAIDSFVVRRGAPSGPWRTLPAQDSAVLSGLRGRIRLVGHAPREGPIAPFIVSAGTQSVEMTPAAKATAGKIVFASPWISSAPALVLTSRVAGTVTIQDVDVSTGPGRIA